ncbi:MAG: VOC family protein [Pseudomonadota bacterium]
MKLLKPHLDLGLFTNDIAAHSNFWGQVVGLRLDHELPVKRGWVQHRYDAHDSVIKVNVRDETLVELPPSGYAGLTIARDSKQAWEGTHPGGGFVRIVPNGTDGVIGIGITITTSGIARLRDFYIEVMEFEPLPGNRARCGDTILFFEQGPSAAHTEDFAGPNYRYTTLQIEDCDAICDLVVSRGGSLKQAPQTLGDVARYAMVSDPDGNWIEISARASLGGKLTPP